MMRNMTEPIRNLLPEKRAERGLTQWDVALKGEINPSQYAKYERGENFPRPDAIEAIARAFAEKPSTVYEWLTTPATPASEEETAADLPAVSQ